MYGHKTTATLDESLPALEHAQTHRCFHVGQLRVDVGVDVRGYLVGIARNVAHYLDTSEQVRSAVLLGAQARPEGIRAAGGLIVQAMSVPQHRGDLILPWSFGHWDTCTVDPSSRVRTAFTSGASQCPHVALTDIPQIEHS